MPPYSLRNNATGDETFSFADDRDKALSELSAKMEMKLTFNDAGSLTDFVFGEHDEGSPFIKHVPVFIAPYS